MTAEPLAQTIPPLESGDRLTRDEFERRYRAAKAIKKAELIAGVVYVASPVRARNHGQPHSRIVTWLGTYEAATPGVMVGDNATVRLDASNEPQPDALLRLDEALGGQSRIGADDYLEGAPELVVEIAASTASYDLHDKLQAYCRNGVREYLVWLPGDRAFRWHVWEAGTYRLQEPDGAGTLKSATFPGLWLNVTALLAGDMGAVLATLQAGLAAAEHREFLRRLGTR